MPWRNEAKTGTYGTYGRAGEEKELSRSLGAAFGVAADKIRAIPPSLRSYGRTGARVCSQGRIFGVVTRGGRAFRVALDPWLISCAHSGHSVCGLANNPQSMAAVRSPSAGMA